LSLAVATVCAGVIYDDYHHHHSKPHIPILKMHSHHNSHDGSYKYAYKTGNGIYVEEEGFVKKDGHKGHEIQVAHGKYSYTDSKGELVSVAYIADEHGFQPILKGKHYD
jgi:Insect cuticle protein